MEFRDHGHFDNLMYGDRINASPWESRSAFMDPEDLEETLDPASSHAGAGWGGGAACDGYGGWPDESPRVPPATGAFGEEFFFAPDP